jgi:hypothetical protein
MAAFLALKRDGSRIPISSAMMPITTNSSTNVNPFFNRRISDPNETKQNDPTVRWLNQTAGKQAT